MSKRWLVPVGLAAAALIATGCGSSSSSSTPAASGGTSTSTRASASNIVNTKTIGGAQVLTDSKGFTLYWFVPDTSTTSKCNGSCAKFWPPVKGPLTAGSGVTGALGTIKRSDGATQATYNGHPLYTYIGDKSPGQNTGNGITASGGLWHEVTASGSAPAPSASPSKSKSGGGGGYGY
jgi:predicted lipoprotein with Yx(FWY)xxD motif